MSVSTFSAFRDADPSAREPRRTAAEISRGATLRAADAERMVRNAAEGKGVLFAVMSPYEVRQRISRLTGLPLSVVQDQLVALGLEA